MRGLWILLALAAAPAGAQTPDAPPAQAYDLRVKGSIVAAQGLQGPLDGGWTVTGPDGSALYSLQVVDRGQGDGVLEGAWRDDRKPGAVGSTGLIDSIERAQDAVITRFSPRSGPGTAVLTLRPRDAASWAGTLVEGATTVAVTAQRQAPPALPAGYVAEGRGPVIWPPRAAPAAAKASQAKSAPAKASKAKKGKAKATTSRKKPRR